MNSIPSLSSSAIVSFGKIAKILFLFVISILSTLPATSDAQDARILEVENIVQMSKGKSIWNRALKDQSLAVGDRIRTRQRSRATVGLTGLFSVRMDQFTTIEITPGLVDSQKPKLDFADGAAFIFSREKAGELDLITPGANAALRGTQLFVRVEPGGKSMVQVLEGQVELNNPYGRLLLKPGEAGEAVPGGAPRRTAVIEANNLLQWALYYPAVIDPSEIGMTAAEKTRFATSLEAYVCGDLLKSVRKLPPGDPSGGGGRLFQAGVLLSVGRVDEAATLAAKVPPKQPGRRALERMIAAVKYRQAPAWNQAAISSASEALAESYYLQSQTKLAPATAMARRATELAPANGFAWTRLAELEFSAGKTKQARAAVEIAERFTPDSARVHALRGFILCAENRIADGRAAFEQSVRLDGSFGNGWLGLGLTKIKKGELEAGRADLQTAATVEPNSSIFHSYLGKAMSQDGRKGEAAKDLELARKLDPDDPTPLLYQAIEDQRNNRTNTAIGNLQESIRLNDNRRLYRSEFLLDQDRAVRSANLARIYQNAGMKGVAVREATRAVESDYTNSSAHQFLSNSYDALRDPDRTLLRYETPWFNELLLSNLLSPVGGGPLSQFVSQQEYSKLLEADGMGGSIVTDWRSTSEMRTMASMFGTQGNVSYGLDYYRREDDGPRPNNDFDLQELYGQIKWQVNPDDVFYFLGKWADQDQGDRFETFDDKALSKDFRFEENQEPGLLLGGWSHRWRPGSATLALVGRLAGSQNLSDKNTSQLLALRNSAALRPGFNRTDPAGRDVFTDPSLNGSITRRPDGTYRYAPELVQAIQPYLGSGDLQELATEEFDFDTHRDFEILTAELQHIEQAANHTILLGGCWQEGNIESDARMIYRGSPFRGSFTYPAVDQSVESAFRRAGLYLYDYWQALPALTLVGGLSWDRIDHPENFRNPPLSEGGTKNERVSGKFGFTWAPSEWITLRGAAARGLGGLTFDESVRLEPSQIAGFSQAYRTVLSESIAGSVEAPEFSILGIAADGFLPTRTWWGLSAGLIDQDVSRSRGIFTGYTPFPEADPAYFADQTRERLDYRELDFSASFNQLIGDQFSLGASWTLSRSNLETSLPDLQPLAGKYTDISILNRISLFGDWNSPGGFFAHIEANAYLQQLNRDETYDAIRRATNSDGDPENDLTNRDGDEFVQFNAWAGYRFNDNLCEMAVGILNIGDTDYQLSPLNPYSDIARERTFFVSCRLSF